MQYLALLYSTEEARPDPDRPDFPEVMAAYRRVTADLTEKNALLGANPLQPVATATSVRLRDGEVLATDGPFAETKERLGGYYLLECESLDHAIEMAAQIPAASYGTVELRPIMPIPAPE